MLWIYSRSACCRTGWDPAQELKQRTYIFYARNWWDREKETDKDNLDLWNTTATGRGILCDQERTRWGGKLDRTKMAKRQEQALPVLFNFLTTGVHSNLSLSEARNVPSLFLCLKPLWNLLQNDPSVLPDLFLSASDRLLSAFSGVHLHIWYFVYTT